MHMIPVGTDIMTSNEETADENREFFDRHGVYVVNLMSAPGAGKTSLLEKTISRLKNDLRLGVIEGDLVTTLDADRIAALGVPSYQITTGLVCHLDARMVHNAFHGFDIRNLDLLFIENVGNLVCPAEFNLGEDLKIMVFSTTEGAEKPKKYPLMFHEADAVILNKIDLIPYAGVALEELAQNVREVNPLAPIFAVSCRTGEGLEDWLTWLELQIKLRKLQTRAAAEMARKMKPASRQRTESLGIGRLRVQIRGAVQGVGFRPFVFRLASELGLTGWVNNSPQGVSIEVEGPTEKLKTFLVRLSDEKPPRSFIQSLESTHLDPIDFMGFEVRQSDETGTKTALVLPDIAVCPDCLSEVNDPSDRRFRYPFTNCTNCGPRYSIIETLPYDRANTTMRSFGMCPECRAEYEDPSNRRFHAQPNACPQCGPQLELWTQDGQVAESGDKALIAAVEAIRSGKVVAVKGLGGFHLMVDARNEAAASELRRRKHREEKPLALMFPTLAAIEAECNVSEMESRLLSSPEAPIVLLEKLPDIESNLAPAIAPGNPYLGAMLPYTPLHHLLMCELGFPVVATSGNISDEPICIDEKEALSRLAKIADLFLVHNRPIARQVDDSIARVMMRREMIVRRSRGFAPLPVSLKEEMPPVLAVGAHLKNSVAISAGHNVFISQHIGDLETKEAFNAFEKVIWSLENLYDLAPDTVACDSHPDYLSTKWAVDSSIPRVAIQHHYAHVLSCMAENEVDPPALGVAWDGTGWGPDGTIWGGEFLRIGETGYERIAHLRTFRLPGGDAAIKEPRRSALGLLFEIFGERVFDKHELFPVLAFMPSELKTIRRMLESGLNAPKTSSAGRLFDAIASILGLRERIRFEGQAAMELEFLAEPNEYGAYNFEMAVGSPSAIDWEPMIGGIIADTSDGMSASRIAAKFHNTLVDMIVRVAVIAGEKAVALSGGCFQNKYLTERAIKRLRENGFNVYWHQRVPTNDGGIALGQIAAAATVTKQANR